jgi:hypothetical protein
VFFPLLKQRGIPEQGGPIGVMLHEHVLGRDCVGRMREASVAQPFDARTFADAGQPGLPVRGGVTSWPNAFSIASRYGAYSSEVTSSGALPPSRRLTFSTRCSAFSPRRLPTSTLSTRRLSGSKATWSYWSPWNRSPGSASQSQFFSFL